MKPLVALGDSFSCGAGVGVHVPVTQTWPAVLAQQAELPMVSLATPGGRMRDVRESQLPRVPEAAVATVFAGLNDVCRGSFDASEFADNIDAVVSGLVDRAEAVIVGRLHDPTKLLWLPRRLGRIVHDRTEAINAAVDRATAGYPRVAAFDLADIPALQSRAAWAADRVHPSVAGHAAIANAAAEQVRAMGGTATRFPQPSGHRAPTTIDHALWLIRFGAPYLARNAAVFARPIAEGLRRAG